MNASNVRHSTEVVVAAAAAAAAAADIAHPYYAMHFHHEDQVIFPCWTSCVSSSSCSFRTMFLRLTLPPPLFVRVAPHP